MSLSSTNEELPIYERPVELLQHLIRFEPTNPPGNERECVEWIDGVLRDGDFLVGLYPFPESCCFGRECVMMIHSLSFHGLGSVGDHFLVYRVAVSHDLP
jgi:hypothetical protein